MAELARGTVLDRPWGRTLAALGLKGLTGQLTVHDGKAYQVAFVRGAVVAAHSPLASDAAVRVAAMGSLVSSTQVADIARRQAAAAGRDEIEVIAELARLGPEQALRLRRRVIAQRAARTFAVERGEFVVEDQLALPVVAGSELDVRAVVYLGARQFLSEARLDRELGQLGAWFQLRSEAAGDLPQFGFGPAERPVVELLRAGASLPALVHPEIDPRLARAVVYALASCNACHAAPAAPGSGAGPRRSSPTSCPPMRAPTPDVAPARRSASATVPPSVAPAARPPAQAGAPIGRARVSSGPPISSRRRRHDPQAVEVEAVIAARLTALARGADHFELLGVERSASQAEVRGAYFALAKQLHPDRLSALGIVDEERRAQRLFAQVNTAFSVISDPPRRREYEEVLARGGERAMRAEEAEAQAIAQRALDAEEAFRRGERALERDQITTALRELERAVELNPDEVEHHAALAWAQFCAAPDKQVVATGTRQALEHAIRTSPGIVTARLYLGRVERMLGNHRDALRHFREVLEVEPRHPGATAELRVLEQRLGADKGGVFARLKR